MAEELVILTRHIEELTSDMEKLRKSVTTLVDKNNDMIDKSDTQVFMKSTIESTMNEINKYSELTIDIEVSETTKQMKSEIQKLQEENKTL